MVGHIPRIRLFSAMIAIFVQHLQLGSFVTGARPCCKAHPPNKGCVIVIHNKTMCLTDEYAVNCEVCPTSGLYGT